LYNSGNENLQKYSIPLKEHIRDGITQSASSVQTSACGKHSDGIHNSPNARFNKDSSTSISCPPFSVQPVDNLSGNTIDPPSTIYRPTGLTNLGNTCYLNSITQCLIACLDSIGHIGSARADPFNSKHLSNILNCFHIGKVDTISKFRDYLKEMDPFLNSSEQQDAHEAFLKVLSVLDTDNSVNIYGDQLNITPVFSSIIKDTFYGTMKNIIVCSICLQTGSVMEEINGLIIDTMASVNEGIEAFLKDTSFTRMCHRCQTTTLHISHPVIWHQPAITVVCINRFQQLQNGVIAKNDAVIHCDPVLSTPCIVGKLVGVVLHKGNRITSGHYTSLVLSGGHWYNCDDSSVTVIDDFDNVFHSKEAYLLFYIR